MLCCAVLCCWVNGVSSGLKIWWSRWCVNQMSPEFINSCRERHKAFIAQRGTNRAGRFLELPAYAVGGWRGLIVIPEGCEGRGWTLFAAEMRKVLLS